MPDVTVQGPIEGSAFVIGPRELRKLPSGYVEEEFFLRGTAHAYDAVGDQGPDGRWQVTPAGSAAYTTRVVVRRPEDPARFNGTAVVEWLNVTGGLDAPASWSMTHRHLSRAGFAWVGVTAQRVGIDGGGLMPGSFFLKQIDPGRYGHLVHPGDSHAFDIFSDAGRAVRDGSLLGPLRPARVLGAGVSQSAMFLTTYVNVFAPVDAVFDGYFVQNRSGGAATLAGQMQLHGGVHVREDTSVPVLTLQAETDLVILGSVTARQPDTDLVRLWEVAGSAHADTYLLSASGVHDDATTIEQLARKCSPTTKLFGMFETEVPINSGPHHHYVAQAALAHLGRWVREGTPPPTADRLEMVGDAPTFVRDEHGIARGGIRTGFVDVPAAVLSGLGQEGNAVAILFGSTRPLPPETLRALYPGGRDDYAERFATATARAVAGGYVLADDAEEMNALAVAMYPE